jgi:L-arabinose isomerase
VLGLLDLGNRFRLVAKDVEVVPPDEPLPKLPVGCAVWKPAPDLPTSAEAWLLAGGPHHTVLSTAVGFESVSDLASILGVELLHIDATTTMRQFSDEVRWNNVYYQLAQGL